MAFLQRHLLDIDSLSAEDLQTILGLADRFRHISERRIKKVPTLRGRTVVNLFMEPSTRTRTSFEIAEKRLSADVVNFSGSASATCKGETLLDTVRNIQAMQPEIIVVRHPHAGAAHLISRHIGAAVVNAGDGAHAHPTQALLDCATILQHKGTIDGLSVAIIGDVVHSRVACSAIAALTKLGASVRLVGPRTLMPIAISTPGVFVHHDLQSALEGVDVVMVLRIQSERLGGECFFGSLREYSRQFGLDARRLQCTKDDAIVMHPGPINRGIELAPDVADGPRSVVLEQVANGVAVRMAVLYLLAGSPPVE